MYKRFIGTTFSPMMLKSGEALVVEVPLDMIKYLITFESQQSYESIVGHEVTARVLSTLLGVEIPFRRVNVELEPTDILLVVTPNFRANEAREFTFEEVANTGYRCFLVTVQKRYVPEH